MDVKEAWKIVKKESKRFGVKVRKRAFDDGNYFIFDYAEDLDIYPLAVDKKTGEVDAYIAFDHPEVKNAKRVL